MTSVTETYDKDYNRFKDKMSITTRRIYVIGIRKTILDNKTYWKVYMMRTPDDMYCQNTAYQAIKRCGLCDEMFSVPNAVASSIASCFFLPYKRDDNWCYVPTWGCEALKANGSGALYAKATKAGYKFIRGMMQGGR